MVGAEVPGGMEGGNYLPTLGTRGISEQVLQIE